MSGISIEGHEIKITNPEKLLWPELGIRKIDYLQKLVELSPFILPHTRDRLLTTIRYPDGYKGKSFYQKNIPNYSPDWLQTVEWEDNTYILLNNTATLVWLGNQATLEFHTAFNYYYKEFYPTDLVFDLDPSESLSFNKAAEAALLINQALKSLDIRSYVKTSGATGLQLYIPVGKRYDYQTARKINKFFAAYFSKKYPEKITIERNVSKRGKKVYFDYLQMWQGKTIIAPYSPRATTKATVSVPVEWEEIEQGINPEDFTLLNIMTRLKEKGDLFRPLLDRKYSQKLDFILKHIKHAE